MAPGNVLGAEGVAALAGALGKLVHLTSLNLGCTWHGGVVCVSRACVYTVPCPSVRGRFWQCEAVWLTWRGWGVCVGTSQSLACSGGSSIDGCAGQAGAPDESELAWYVVWDRGVCAACVYACRAVSGCAWEVVAV